MLTKHIAWVERNTGLTKPVQSAIALLITVSLFLTVYSALAVTENEIVSIVQIIIVNDKGEAVSSGSGVIIDEEGDILTNYHVLEDAIKNDGWYPVVLVTVDPKKPPVPGLLVKLVGYSEPFDLALMRFTAIKDSNGNLVDFKEFVTKNDLYVNHVKIDRYANDEKVSLGDPVQILGYPGVGGKSITFTKGIVSGFEQLELEDTTLPWLIKTDAKVNPGNSGGGAFDAADNFIGVPEAVAGGPGNIGYVISLPVINYFLNKTLGAPAVQSGTQCIDTVNGFLGDDGNCYCNPGYEWGDAANKCVPSKTSSAAGITVIPANIDDAYCEANVRKNSVFNPATGNCECRKGMMLMNYECVPRPMPKYFTGVPKSRTDILNCLVVADPKVKAYWLRGHKAIKTMSLKNKTCLASEADAKKAKYRKK
ncbi:MAG TPA: trypsin-like peptidase domain-containing protein [Candidatus Methylomirabilis sp.]|nr:trypsin-like peptidase domain-containing protein [Candidatus Methylomirabilis sp.]